MTNKLNAAKKEINDLKLNFQQKCKELEVAQKEFSEYKEQQKENSVYNSKENAEIKKLNDEIQKLRSLNKNRDEII